MKKIKIPNCPNCNKRLYPVYNGEGAPFLSLKHNQFSVCFICAECDSDEIYKHTEPFKDIHDFLFCLGVLLNIDFDIEIDINKNIRR